ncbi:MAG TPA: bifunctional serine/threonine-protein kinase/formylglycine-generating enzyme family protein [Polyangiaceae bacterium]|nr:bifunctional serine/threonine-protein kinase/formylglycine-generating enzyme family protein [Polyangiaceae bacterium]
MTPFRSPPIDSKTIDSPSSDGQYTIDGTVSLQGSFESEGTLREGEAPAPISTTEQRISAAPISSTEARHLSDVIDPKRYSLLGKIGAGGMATVYLARDQSLLRSVALKVQHADPDGGNARFLEEAQVLGQLEHPNIVPLYTLEFTTNNSSFSTMRYLRGSSLHDVLRCLSTGDTAIVAEYSLTRLMQIFLQITQAVSYAHHQGVIHRDLKPANVMLGEHGEVQVVDWGIAKVRTAAGVHTDSQRDGLTMPGQIVGTPSYMAPEQWAGAAVDERADIYALGVILYELLTLQRPFNGNNPLLLCREVLTAPPPPLRSVAPDRSIPLELEEACLKALAKLPEDRQSHVRELYRAVQAWLETETDRVRRHTLAEEKVAEARELLRVYQLQRKVVADLEQKGRELESSFKSWQSVDEKRDLYDADQAVRTGRRQLIDLSTDVVGVLTEALGFERENTAARQLLADYYWDRLLEAESLAQPDQVGFYSRLVRRYHDGRYSKRLSGDGTLSLVTEPAGAVVRVYKLEEQNLLLQPGTPLQTGSTPLQQLTLGPGSYVVHVELAGYAPLVYPVYISRNRDWAGTLRLRRTAEIAPGFCQVPGGPFIEGGDSEGWSLPRNEPEVGAFAIARHPVTVREYLEFLNDLAQTDLALAVQRAPRRAPDGGSYALHDAERGFEFEPHLPENVAELDAPVSSISWYDAVAYAEWRSAKDQRTYRLPTAREWEKAARGVDGRWFPWGNRFDASLCNIRESTKDGPRIAPVEAFPHDESVYGVRGMAGNMRDWTETASNLGANSSSPLRVVRGGAWYGGRVSARCADRFWFEPNHVYFFVGFRLAHSLTDSES